MMFKKICIIGCGLIGSSIARAVKKNNLSEKVVSSNRSAEINKKVIELKIVDESSSEAEQMVSNSDLTIIATPLSSYESVILKIKSSLKIGSIITDVGSVKGGILNLIENHVPENVSWIPSHPIAGTEESGPEAGFSELFKNRWCILTPSKKAKEKDVNLLKVFWEKIGSKVDIMEAKKHDHILAITSHMPHLIAYNIVTTSLNIQDEKKSEIVKYSASGLRDFTRIAASNPIMWRDIFIQNKKNTSELVNKFISNLEELKKAIENEDGKKLEEIFSKTKKIRKDILDAGQDVNKPDFGRKQ
jgi:cyclohexadieny/prephenate dehydrogenase